MEISQVESLFDRVGMDLLGPFPRTTIGNHYIIVVVDYVTKWAEVVALGTAGAKEVAQFFVSEIVLRHGAPRNLTTDEGMCFMAELMKRVMDALETNHRPTTAYHPQANGQVERLNHTLEDMLPMLVVGHIVCEWGSLGLGYCFGVR